MPALPSVMVGLEIDRLGAASLSAMVSIAVAWLPRAAPFWGLLSVRPSVSSSSSKPSSMMGTYKYLLDSLAANRSVPEAEV